MLLQEEKLLIVQAYLMHAFQYHFSEMAYKNEWLFSKPWSTLIQRQVGREMRTVMMRGMTQPWGQTSHAISSSLVISVRQVAAHI
jgi:hypothetical protein